ncbi:hypothetical protein DICVIV_04815 [Dictyocaulus viviparus]|uniref:Uncharacterized protein n=1 Tax=Dictyocaulus viviparus TaxID=29172 RepID=A0A0D8Y382_DICVI|nr:hypothetical protein DICVIV_04815 [Dictyocaulus viviparus]
MEYNRIIPVSNGLGLPKRRKLQGLPEPLSLMFPDNCNQLKEDSSYAESVHALKVIHYNAHTPNVNVVDKSDSVDSDLPYVERKSKISLNLKEAPSYAESVHALKVIHYNAHTPNVNVVDKSDSVDSDLPYVERKSNIFLNDLNGYKTIRVTQYDGCLGKSNSKEAVSSSSKLWKPSSASSSTVEKNIVTCRKTKSNAILVDDVRANSTDVMKAAEISREYETLKKKFDLWQLLQVQNRNSPEARQLHMELMCEHDTLMKKLERVGELYTPTTRRRPGIAADTFRITGERDIIILHIFENAHFVYSGASISILQNLRQDSPTHYRVIGARHCYYYISEKGNQSFQLRQLSRIKGYVETWAGFRSSNEVLKEQIASGVCKTPTVDVQEKKIRNEQALQRILEEANDLRRREEELRECSTNLVSKRERNSVPTSTTSSGYENPNDAAVSPLPKKSHDHIITNAHKPFPPSVTSVTNNNPAQTFSTIQTNPRHMSDESSLIDALKEPSPSLPEISLIGNQSLEAHSFSKFGHISHEYQPQRSGKLDKASNACAFPPNSSPNLNINGRKVPGKLSLKTIQTSSSEITETASLPATPNTESNIRKVKEAVKQQSIGPKSANSMLLQAHLAAKESQSLRKGVEVAELKSTISGNTTRNSSNEELQRGAANGGEEKPSSVRKAVNPVENNGIVIAKVPNSSSQNQSNTSITANDSFFNIFGYNAGTGTSKS